MKFERLVDVAGIVIRPEGAWEADALISELGSTECLALIRPTFGGYAIVVKSEESLSTLEKRHFASGESGESPGASMERLLESEESPYDDAWLVTRDMAIDAGDLGLEGQRI